MEPPPMNKHIVPALAVYVATLSENEALSENDRGKRAAMWRTMLECLNSFGLAVVGSLLGSTVIRDKTYVLWTVSDNGGELNVERINAPETLRSVPYTSWRTMLDGATMAYRVRCVVDDCAIEYDRSFAEDVEILSGGLANT